MRQTMTLKDGRKLSYREFGDAAGTPILHFHGLNSSSLELFFAEEKLKQQHIRLIAFDRPGFGGSDLHAQRTLFTTVEDAAALMRHLNIDRYALQSVSAGTAYLLAMLRMMPENITSARIISGAVPVEEVGMDGMHLETKMLIGLARRFPWLMHPVFWFTYGRLVVDDRSSKQFLDAMVKTLGDPDKVLMQNEEARSIFLKIARDSYAQGSIGNAYDALLVFGKPWGFSVTEIDFGNIEIVHGREDLAIPFELMKKMHRKLKGSSLRGVEKEGHLSLVYHLFV